MAAASGGTLLSCQHSLYTTVASCPTTCFKVALNL